MRQFTTKVSLRLPASPRASAPVPLLLAAGDSQRRCISTLEARAHTPQY